MLELFPLFSGGCIITFIYCVIVLSLLEVLMGCHRPLSGLWYIFQSILSPVCSKFILHTIYGIRILSNRDKSEDL